MVVDVVIHLILQMYVMSIIVLSTINIQRFYERCRNGIYKFIILSSEVMANALCAGTI
jgi:hypothetical protein